MEPKTKRLVIGVAVLACLGAVAYLLSSCAEKLSSYEVGLKYDKVWKKLDQTAKDEGLYFGPPGFDFIVFPSVFKTIEFTQLICLNKDGVPITLDISYQHKARVGELRKIVSRFRDHDNYVTVLRAAGIAAIHEACSLYNTSQFQAERGNFQETVSSKLSERYQQLDCDVSEIQVRNIARPADYETAIQAKEAAKENINVAKNERSRKIIEAETEKKQAETQAEITVAYAQSQARIILNRAKATAAAILNAYSTEAETYAEVMSSSGLGLSQDAFISYMGIRAVSNAKNPVHIGMKSPAKTSYVKL